RLPRVVCGLVRRHVLRALASAESDGLDDRDPPREPGRRVAPCRPLEPGRAPVLAAPAPAVFRLRRPAGPRCPGRLAPAAVSVRVEVGCRSGPGKAKMTPR